MKELSIEEKAKRFDIALDKIKRLLGSGSNCSREELEYVFPELKESESEKIRKDLIIYLRSVLANKEYGDKFIEDWIAWLENQNKKTEPIEDFDTEFERQISHLVASAINKEHEYNQGYIKWAAQSLIEYAKREIEKQGEQKLNPVLGIEIPFRAKDSELQEASYYIPEGFHAEIDGNREVIKRGEQKPDSGGFWEGYNTAKEKFEQKPADKIEPKFKVGDTIIKKHNSDILCFGSFTITDITGGKYWYNDRIICDITEQDDWEIYEPVSQKSAEWSEEDELHIRELESLVKQVWATAEHENDKDTIHKMSDLSFFLKTLKPQPKQEWSEEGRIHYNKCLQYLESISLRKEDVEWFKSLKERYTWKPSDEQMDMLAKVCSTLHLTSGENEIMESIYDALKKLMEK